MGPYDRRTVVGMRIKHTLTSEQALEDGRGRRLTVADLLGRRVSEAFQPLRSGVFSVVQATFSASLISARDGSFVIPLFKGEVEVRVQSDVLRLAGRFKQRFRWREDRVKLPLGQIVHARQVGSRVDLWLDGGTAGNKPGATKLQHLALDLFTAGSAAELVQLMPAACAPPLTMPGPLLDVTPAAPHGRYYLVWIGGIGVAVVVLLMLLLLGLRRAI